MITHYVLTDFNKNVEPPIIVRVITEPKTFKQIISECDARIKKQKFNFYNNFK